MNEPVVLTIPSSPEHLSLLRALVGYYAGREQFTIDQIDDLRMAVDESGVQLLRRIAGETVRLELARTSAGITVRVSATVADDAPVIDEESFSWTILQALADDLSVTVDGDEASVVLTKNRLEGLAGPGGA